jgi:hypothetical protein
VNLITKRNEVFCPSYASSEIGIVGIEFKPIPVCQAVEHGIDHVVQLNEEATINASMVD